MEPAVSLHTELQENEVRIRISNSALPVVVVVVHRFLEPLASSFEFDFPGSVTIGSVKRRRRKKKLDIYREREREKKIEPTQGECEIPRKLEKGVTKEEEFDTWIYMIGSCELGACWRRDVL